eukprot:6646392-Alexandrium_andersonii.AAC.1
MASPGSCSARSSDAGGTLTPRKQPTVSEQGAGLIRGVRGGPCPSPLLGQRRQAYGPCAKGERP